MIKKEIWIYNINKYCYERTENDPLSVFPTIVNFKDKLVFCKRCKRWEPICGFKNNVLLSQCGRTHTGPFFSEPKFFNYGFIVTRDKGKYIIDIKTQYAGILPREQSRYETEFIIDYEKKLLFQNGEKVFEANEIYNALCKEVTDELLNEMGEKYKLVYGLKPTVASQLKGLSLITGYMLAPFNINFYKIAHHWGLCPFDKEFANLSSGDTPTAENEMFESLNIKPTKSIRKQYQSVPYSVICYAAAKDLGFTDVNILQKSSSSIFYVFLSYYMISFAGGTITYTIREPLQHYVMDLLALTNQKTVWNSIERTVEIFTNDDDHTIVTDGLQSYETCRQHLTNDEKKEIMREGFNRYTHDYLVRRLHQLGIDDGSSSNGKEKNILFDIESKFLALEYKAGDDKKSVKNPQTGLYEIVDRPDKERFCFYVARDSATLKTIGSKMHNCVGWGYTNSVAERNCTIVYAVHDNNYKICIEVAPDFSIRQALGPCNKPLENKSLEAYQEWCSEKNIKFVKAFAVHGAID